MLQVTQLLQRTKWRQSSEIRNIRLELFFIVCFKKTEQEFDNIFNVSVAQLCF